MIKYLVLAAIFVASLNATCGTVLVDVFTEAIHDRVAIIEAVAQGE